MAKHYYISFNSVDFTEIFPVNNPIATYMQMEGTRVWREEVDEIKLTKTKNSTVYTTLAAYFVDKTKFDDELEIEIYTGLRGTGTLYFSGVFSISDSEIDLEYTTFKIKPRLNDNYRTIIEKADTQYDLILQSNLLKVSRVGYSQSFSMATTWVNGAIGTAFTTWNAVGGTILTSYHASSTICEAYLQSTEGVSTGDIIVVDVSAFDSVASSATFNIMQAAGLSITDEGARSIATGQIAFTISETVGTPRLWFQSNPDGESSLVTFSIRRIDADNEHTLAGTLLMTFIENFLDNVTAMYLTAYTGNVLSTFIDNDALPSDAPSTIDTWITAHPNGNYVSLTENSNELNTAILGLLYRWFPTSDQSEFKLSFNDIMGQLREALQVYWYIDGDGKFRIEHEKYFVKLVDDSTPIALTNYPMAEIDARALNYDKARIASVEQFSWAQASNQDFVGQNLIYNNFETTNNTIEHSVNYITTDIKYVIDNLSDASSAGMGLYHCQLLTGITDADLYEIIISTGAITSAAISNAAFSWANLHEKYWTWSRMSENATMNSVATSMQSGVRFLLQEGVNFYYATAINPFTMITTTLTGAAPIEIRRNLETDYIEMILGYDPYKL